MEKNPKLDDVTSLSKNLPNEEIINEIINSEDFRKKLKIISANYTNLKQENVIKNYILEKLNEYFSEGGHSQKKAFAEHPRNKGSRVDLSIIDNNELDKFYKIEFKYQFSGDNKNMTDYARIIDKDFEKRSSDLFILIIAHWKKSDKKEFDKNWNITSKLSRYISDNEEWTGNIREAFKTFEKTENSKLIEFEKIQIEKPFRMEYYFYILKRI